MDAPIIKLNKFGDREVDWENGSKWSEFGKYNNQNQYQFSLKYNQTKRPFCDIYYIEGGCKCKDLVNRNRVGNCEGRKPSQFNGQHFTCYVFLPSNCSDLKTSTTNPGEKFSAEACFKKGSKYICQNKYNLNIFDFMT